MLWYYLYLILPLATVRGSVLLLGISDDVSLMLLFSVIPNYGLCCDCLAARN